MRSHRRVTVWLGALALVGYAAAAQEIPDEWDHLRPKVREVLLENIQEALGPGEAAKTPAEQAITSLSELQKRIRKEAKRGRPGFGPVTDEVSFCRATFNALCLNGRFIVEAVWDNPYDPFGAYIAGARQLTPQSGVLWFLDPTNFEVVVKELNGCFTGPFTHWVFMAGLTDFEVAVVVFDAATGINKTYVNPPRQNFNMILDQNTPFPCP